MSEKMVAFSQTAQYARDLKTIYNSEKRKTKELEAVNRELVQLSRDLEKSNRELKKAYLDTLYRLALAAEYKDNDTGGHISRISRYSVMIAEKMGLDPEYIDHIRHASPMHDVGKIGIPDHILLKPRRLTDQEFEIMKTHTLIGEKILSGSKSRLLKQPGKLQGATMKNLTAGDIPGG